jgi:hypothetical protein
MAYQIDRFNRTLLTVVADGTIDETTDLRFVGKNFAGYGETHNENFLFLLENFSSASPPPRPISGQVWFDSAQRKLKFYDGFIWRATGGSEVTASEPAGLTEGDFWWDTFNDQLYVFNGNAFILIGPQDAGGTGITQLVSQTIQDTNNTTRSIIVSFINDNPVIVISPVQFNILNTPGNTLDGFDLIRQGITLKNTNNTGITTSAYRFFGTASDSDKLGGTPASDFARLSTPSFSDQIIANGGININGNVILESSISTVDGIIRNSVANGNLQFKVADSGNTTTSVATVTIAGIEPASNGTFDLGTAALRFRKIYADSFEGGAASQADSILLDPGVYITASIPTLPTTIVVRDAQQRVFANEFNGVASSAKYADLAEKYTTDAEYPVGTIMCVGGNAETTAARAGDVAIGVISAAPAYLMNAACNGQAIGLKGRVPVRVQGIVAKGQLIYAHSAGTGSTVPDGAPVGIALEGSNTTSESLIECVLKV